MTTNEVMFGAIGLLTLVIVVCIRAANR
jgi:hypothetical protein